MNSQKGKPRPPRVIYPDLRPGVKACHVCGIEFEANDTAHGRAGWRYRRFCGRKCQVVHKSRMERQRLRAKGLSASYYRMLAQERRAAKQEKPTALAPRKRHLDPLGALPPEARTNSLEEAMNVVMERHEDWSKIFLEEVRRRHA